MKKKKLISITFCILLIIGIVVVYLKEAEKRKPLAPWEMTERHIISLKPTVSSVDWLNNNQWLLVSFKRTKLPKNYSENKKSIEYDTTTPIVGLKRVVLMERKSVEHMNTGNDRYYTTDYKLDLYAVKKEKLEKEKTIDLHKIVKSYNSSYSVRSVFSFTSDEQFLDFAVNGVNGFFYLDLKTEKIIKESDMDPTVLKKTEEATLYPVEYEYVFATNFMEKPIVKNNGLWMSSSNPTKEIGIRYKRKETLPPSSLEENYPEIQKIYPHEGFGYLNYSKAPPTPEELAKLLVPKGVDPWEGVVINANRSKDQKEHPIGSVEEFLQWYQRYQPEEEKGTTESNSE